ncbi:uncharacterized protein LOC111357079 [Spodoptera litura]|uniref:Uncharacterized protein LOC111357079 n=1 Tax=Spodoptera litura TaxID=69820 RepID=A0A9J7EAG1_SPOLT|nr:uncharacterized protein LOC111357079 [Spodoptera litura]
MEGQFQLLFDKMKIEMQKQTSELSNAIMEKIEEKLKPIVEENKNLKIKVGNLEKKLDYLQREKKSNNIIIHGILEEEKSTLELFENLKKVFRIELGISMEEYDEKKISRIGKSIKGDKPRPVLLGLNSAWKRTEILKKKKNFKNIYVTEDYSKETIEKRKALQPKLAEEMKKGNIAYIKYDKLVVKENTNANDKRKREDSNSPQADIQPKKQQTLMASKNNRVNAFDFMRRSNSLSTIITEGKQ